MKRLRKLVSIFEATVTKIGDLLFGAPCIYTLK